MATSVQTQQLPPWHNWPFRLCQAGTQSLNGVPPRGDLLTFTGEATHVSIIK
jgi:hypothetical protein